MQKVFIVASKRTPIGKFGGGLSTLRATELGAIATKNTLESVGFDPSKIDEVILGNVLQAASGQNPARQVCLGSGIPISVPNTLINKVCASGLKSVMLGAQSIQTGYNNVVLTGGFESMSTSPFYLPDERKGHKFSDSKILDSIAFDGLTDPYNNCAMGLCAEKTADDFKVTRELQDAYAIKSYERAIEASKNGLLNSEIIDITIRGREIKEDEEPEGFRRDKIPQLLPIFSRNGTVTAANASKLNDGACSILIMSEEAVKEHNLTPIAEVVSFADYEVDPIDFNIAPAGAAKKALKNANLEIEDIDFFEFNEAFSVTGLANMKILGIGQEGVNVNGGAVALGHPLGMSGARILRSLMTVLEQQKGKYGLAAICNGGGGASSMIIKRCT